MTANATRNSDTVYRGSALREALQRIEDALIDAGYDDITVSTNRGSFHWMTVERARQRDQGNEPQP